MNPATLQRPILQLRSIKRRFQLGDVTIDALRGISLDIHAGEFLAAGTPAEIQANPRVIEAYIGPEVVKTRARHK